ncbi:MAG: dihydrolipoyl dehydrogenase [Bdellovibrionota bacterium]
MNKKVDVAIIGAGSAGLSAWSEVKKKTQNVIMINSGSYGTTCARVGCMPSKVFLQTANDFYRRHKFTELGISGSDELRIDAQAVMQRVRNLRDRFVRGVLSGGFKELGDRNIKGHARILSPQSIEVNGEKIAVDKLIVATGSVVNIPSSWNLSENLIITSDSIFELNEFPKKIAVIGLGVISLELGQAMSRLGVDVCMVGQSRRIAGLTDPQLIDEAHNIFSREFPIWVDSEVKVEQQGMDKVKVTCGERCEVFDAVFAGTGRRPNIDGLGLENLGVSLNSKGLPKIDPSTMQVENLPVYLAGDLTGERGLLHEASDEGRIAGYNAVNDKQQCFVRRAPLGIVFTDPNIVIAGSGYQGLNQEDFVSGEVSYEGQGRALVMAKNKGLLKVYGGKQDGKILGAEMLAPSGEHLGHLLAWSIQQKLTVFDMLKMPFYHPVVEEGLRTALRDLSHKVVSSRDCSSSELAFCEAHPEGGLS